jgi:hypothetical protein
LAISHFIGDLDVVGGSGGNVGFVINNDSCETVKIDPG